MTASSWLKLANKTAIVTGAGSGIGAAVALALAKEKCRLVLADVSHDSLQAIEKKCNTPCKTIVTDVTHPNQVTSLINHADEFATSTRSSILINCAGITRDAFCSKMTLEEWHDVMDVNLTGTFLTCQAFCQASRVESLNGESAAIINVGSIVSQQGNLGQVNYAASKGGVLGLTRALAKEMASQKIRVNAVLPGFIDTTMTRAVPEHFRHQIVKRIALQRFGQAEDVANLILFLASCKRSGYITGECMTCSGMISL